MDRDPGLARPGAHGVQAGLARPHPLAMNPTFTDVDDLDKLAQGAEGVEWTHWGDMVNIYGVGDDGSPGSRGTTSACSTACRPWPRA